MAKNDKKYDLISIGEPLLRFSPPHCGQISRTSSFDVSIAGSQLNVASNLAVLGKRTAFITKLPDDPLGYLVMNACRSYGVDTSLIQMMPGGKMGVTYVEFSVTPRTPLAIYDRIRSASSTILPEDFEWDKITQKTVFAYTDGIFPGLSEGCCEAAVDFIHTAKKNGCTTCFDVNYREHLWKPEKALKAWSKILKKVDILVTNRDVSKLVFGYSGSDKAIMGQYAENFGCEVVCLTARQSHGLLKGAWNCKALVEDQIIEGKRFDFDIVDRYGSGDAWFAGFIYGYMEKDIKFSLDFANALCALAHTIEGDVANVTANTVIAILGAQADLS